jgi:4-hydroxybutyryl-CoA dehydratase/vinylacetyl-CoA-Delta-isomerase
MNIADAAPTRANLMTGAEYRESLRRLRPVVYVDGRVVESVADDPALQPGINALAYTYDFARDPAMAPIALATQARRNRVVNRMLHVNDAAGDLLNKLEAVRILCQETGCAQRYLAHDALNGIAQAVAHIDDARGTTELRARFDAYLADVQERDLSLGIAMTDAKGDRSKRPHEQANPDTYVHVVDRTAKGLLLSGTKAIVTGAPYMHELLVMPGRNMGREDADFAVCCAVPVDAPGVTIVSRPAGRPGEKWSTATPVLAQVRPVHGRRDVRPRAGAVGARFFDASGTQPRADLQLCDPPSPQLHRGARRLRRPADRRRGADVRGERLDPGSKSNLREPMVELIKIVEGFYACGVAASVYATQDAHTGTFMPDPVFSNIGKLLLATQIYDMHRLAHEVSGGLIVALPGPDEDHNPATAARLSEVLRASPDVPYDKRIEVARFMEDLTASYQGGWYSLISLHGGGSPAAMKQEIWRNYPVGNKVELVERLLERGVLHQQERAITRNRQPGRCCDTGCTVPGSR